VRVAVIDSGVNEVPELTGRLDPGGDFTRGCCPWGDDTSDTDGHGTQVAALIAAHLNNGTGIAGVAPGARIVPIKVCCTTDIIVDALSWIVDENNAGSPLNVTNISAVYAEDDTIQYRLEQLVAQGGIVVASAGNFGVGEVRFPASITGVVAVAGVDSRGVRHSASNYGSQLDVSAPIASWSRDHLDRPQLFWGTSASAAIISGVAALWQSTRPDFGVRENVTADFLDDIDASNPGGWDNQTGRGVPNAYLTIWRSACQRKDVRRDNRIDGYDEQTIAYYWGAFYGIQRSGVAGYDPTFDLHPFPSRDGRIDIIDIQSVFALDGATCPA